MAGLIALLKQPAVCLGASALVVFGVQRLVPTFKPDWYKALRKPKWTPPNYVFPLVWIPLKCMQSVALSLVVQAALKGAPKAASALALGTFSVHLFLGNWWNVVFFGQHKLKESLPWMYLFWASVAGSAAAFKPLNPVAAALMLPTLAWVTVAAKLNQDVVSLNEDVKDADK